jgi:hypothetical protein
MGRTTSLCAVVINTIEPEPWAGWKSFCRSKLIYAQERAFGFKKVTIAFDVVFFGLPLSPACQGHCLFAFQDVRPGYAEFTRLFLGELGYQGTLVCIGPNTTTMGDIRWLYSYVKTLPDDCGLRLIHYSHASLTGDGTSTEPHLKAAGPARDCSTLGLGLPTIRRRRQDARAQARACLRRLAAGLNGARQRLDGPATVGSVNRADIPIIGRLAATLSPARDHTEPPMMFTRRLPSQPTTWRKKILFWRMGNVYEIPG